MLAELNTWAFGTVGSPNFGVKYYEGRARPEVCMSQSECAEIGL